jgi:hypothetical protein
MGHASDALGEQTRPRDSAFVADASAHRVGDPTIASRGNETGGEHWAEWQGRRSGVAGSDVRLLNPA